MRYFVCLLLLAGPLGCATHRAQAVPVGAEADAALRQRMLHGRSRVQSFSGEARLTYFSHGLRVRGSASIAVQRPHGLRYDVQGPQGGVLFAVASDGATLQVVDFQTSHVMRGPASAASFDHVVQWVPLGLDTVGWVDLFFGEMAIPAQAQLLQDTDGYVFRWDAERQVAVHVDAITAQVSAIEMSDLNGRQMAAVQVHGRDRLGLPAALNLQAEGQGGHLALEIVLRDLTYDPALPAGVFNLPLPRGMTASGF